MIDREGRPLRLREGDAITTVASVLTDRDRLIADDCYEHLVLTTEQIRRLHFNGTRTAEARLRRLHELRVLDRFRPTWEHGEGSTPYHWVLDTPGTHIVAAGRDLEPAQLRWPRQAAMRIRGSSTLPHRHAVNEFATQLIAEHGATGGEVPEWRGERSTRQLFEHLVAPDSYLLLQHPDTRSELHLLLEIDRGTEDHNRLLTKARRYAKAIPRSPLATLDPLVLLVVPSERRARTLATTLAGAPWPIEIAAWDGHRSPLAITRAAAGEERGVRGRARVYQEHP